MTQHLHGEFVEGCYRCDLGRDEVATAATETRPLLVRMDAALHAAIAATAEREDRSMASLARSALRAYVRKSAAQATRQDRAVAGGATPEAPPDPSFGRNGGQET